MATALVGRRRRFPEPIFSFRIDLGADPWGETMHWWFVVADEIHFNRPSLAVPREWRFRPSPLGPSNEPDDLVVEVIREITDANLIRFGRVLHRYAGLLKHHGMDY